MLSIHSATSGLGTPSSSQPAGSAGWLRCSRSASVALSTLASMSSSMRSRSHVVFVLPVPPLACCCAGNCGTDGSALSDRLPDGLTRETKHAALDDTGHREKVSCHSPALHLQGVAPYRRLAALAHGRFRSL